MNFQLKHRTTSAVLFSVEAESPALAVEAAVNAGVSLCGVDLRGLTLRGVILRAADFRAADLYDTDLRGADLRDTDFRGSNWLNANTSGADLRGAVLSDDISISTSISPLQIIGLGWSVMIFDRYMKIGCELHSIDEWAEFPNRRIKLMSVDVDALGFWSKHKEFLLAAAIHAQRDVGATTGDKK